MSITAPSEGVGLVAYGESALAVVVQGSGSKSSAVSRQIRAEGRPQALLEAATRQVLHLDMPFIFQCFTIDIVPASRNAGVRQVGGEPALVGGDDARWQNGLP
jgi:hypothetical protein